MASRRWRSCQHGLLDQTSPACISCTAWKAVNRYILDSSKQSRCLASHQPTHEFIQSCTAGAHSCLLLLLHLCCTHEWLPAPPCILSWAPLHVCCGSGCSTALPAWQQGQPGHCNCGCWVCLSTHLHSCCKALRSCPPPPLLVTLWANPGLLPVTGTECVRPPTTQFLLLGQHVQLEPSESVAGRVEPDMHMADAPGSHVLSCCLLSWVAACH